MKSLLLLVLTIACVKGQPVKPSKSQKSPDLREVDDIHNKKKNKESIAEINLSHGILSDMKFRDGSKREAGEIWKDSSGKPHIPYVINTKGGKDFSKVIKEGINAMNYHMSACGQKVWVPRKNQKDYVEITTSEDGCWAVMGKVGGKQQLNIGKGCDYKETVLHEMLHSMGFDHEQSRNDRDNFVKIVWDNIQPNQSFNFDKNEDFPSIPSEYDLFSVMHYGLWDFSKYKPEIKKYKIKKENYKTIKVRSDYEILTPEQELKIGDVDDLSETDIYEVNVMYGCYDEDADESNVLTLPQRKPIEKADSGNDPSTVEKAVSGNGPPIKAVAKVADEPTVHIGPPIRIHERKREGLELVKELDNLLGRFKEYIGSSKDELEKQR